MEKHKIYTMSFASVYPHYVAKAEKKGRTKAEVDEVICWLTGYNQKQLEKQIDKETGEYLGYDDLAPNEERFEELSLMLGYVDGERSPCKEYDLKINLRSGADPKVIATTTVSVELK